MASKLLKNLRSEVKEKLDLICGGEFCPDAMHAQEIIFDDKSELIKMLHKKFEEINNKKK